MLWEILLLNVCNSFNFFSGLQICLQFELFKFEKEKKKKGRIFKILSLIWWAESLLLKDNNRIIL